MRIKLFGILIFGVVSIVPVCAGAQDTSSAFPTAPIGTVTNAPSFRGFNAYETFRGLVTSSGALLKLDSSVGYDFNRYFGIFAGVPVYFTSSFDAGASAQSVWASGMGDAYVGAELYTFSRVLRYSTSIAVGLPTGDVRKGFSPGNVTVDWTNHFRRSFGRVTPAFSIGAGNSVGIGIGAVPSSELIDRSLTSTGKFVHMEEGADFDLTEQIYVGGAGYHILPFGNRPSESDAGANAIVPRENGFDTWIGFQPKGVVRTEIGYSRSMTFERNSLSFKLGLDVGAMFRRNGSQH
jgi:hypothetical protein